MEIDNTETKGRSRRIWGWISAIVGGLSGVLGYRLGGLFLLSLYNHRSPVLRHHFSKAISLQAWVLFVLRQAWSLEFHC